jgi:hypothetical protein
VPAWVSLIAGFIGALIGAGGTILAQERNARHQRQRATEEQRNDRERANATQLGQLVTQLVADSYAFTDAAVELRRAVADATLADEARGRWAVYMDRWAAVMQANGAVLVTAPRHVVKAAMELRMELVRVAATTDSCFFFARNDTPRKLSRAIDEQGLALAAARTSRSRLAAVTRKVLPDDVEDFDELADYVDSLNEQEAERSRALDQSEAAAADGAPAAT